MILSLLVSLLLRPTFNSCSVEVDESLKGCKVEYRQSGGKWISADPFMGSLLNLKEDTRYEVRFRDGKEILAKESFKTWRTNVPVAKTIVIDPETFSAPYVINEKGTEDGWVRYTVKGDSLHNNAPVPTFEIKDAEYILIDNMILTGVPDQKNVIIVSDSKAVRVRNCDISDWGRIGAPNFETFFDPKRKYHGRGGMYDALGKKINWDGAIYIGRGTSEMVVERCYIHDSFTHTNSWYYSHPAGSECIMVDCPDHSTVIRYNDFVGSDGYCFNDCVEGVRNFFPDGGFHRDADIYGNFMIFSNDDCIEIDGGQKNVRVWGNRFESSYCGLSIQGCMVGPSLVWNNLFSGMGEEFGMAGQTIKTYGRHGETAKTYIWGNTLWGKGSGTKILPKMSFIVHDNILCGRQAVRGIENSPSSQCYNNREGVDMDEKDLDPTCPIRDIPFVLDRTRVSVDSSKEPIIFKIKGKLPKGTKVFRPDHSDWFNAELHSDKVVITFNEDKMHNRRTYRGAFVVRTPDGLSRSGSIYVSTDFIPPYKCEKEGQYAVYDNDFNLKGCATSSSTLNVDKDGRYWILIHGKCGQGDNPRNVKLMVSIDGSEELLSKQTMYGYPTWSVLHPMEEDTLLGLVHFDLTKGEHVVKVRSESSDAEFDGVVLTDSPWMFEPNKTWID